MTEINPDADWLKRAWIWSYKGQELSLLDYSVIDVDIEEIAHALAMTCRFGGHCKKFYSVAEHCVIVSEIMEERGNFSSAGLLGGLLHDAAEYILTDVPKPFKHLITDYKSYEDRIMNVIEEKYNINCNTPYIKMLDQDMVVSEAIALFKYLPEWIAEHPGSVIPDFESKYLACHDPEAAEFAFIERFRELTKPRVVHYD